MLCLIIWMLTSMGMDMIWCSSILIILYRYFIYIIKAIIIITIKFSYKFEYNDFPTLRILKLLQYVKSSVSPQEFCLYYIAIGKCYTVFVYTVFVYAVLPKYIYVGGCLQYLVKPLQNTIRMVQARSFKWYLKRSGSACVVFHNKDAVVCIWMVQDVEKLCAQYRRFE
jgi:hypothetical protein